MAKDTKKKAQALPEAEENAAPPKKSKKKLIIIIVVLLLLTIVGAGAGGYWWFFIHKPGEPIFASEQAKTEEHAGTPAADEEKKKAETQEKKEGHDAQGTVQKPRELPRGKGVVVPLPLITVNIFENGGHRYLKLGMEVEASRDISKELKDNEARVRDAVIMLLAGKSYAEIASPDGKVMLKVEVMNRLNQIIGEQRVTRVYFTDFVVQ